MGMLQGHHAPSFIRLLPALLLRCHIKTVQCCTGCLGAPYAGPASQLMWLQQPRWSSCACHCQETCTLCATSSWRPVCLSRGSTILRLAMPCHACSWPGLQLPCRPCQHPCPGAAESCQLPIASSAMCRQLTSYRGDPDPFKGDVPNQRVRDAAQGSAGRRLPGAGHVLPAHAGPQAHSEQADHDAPGAIRDSMSSISQ